MYVYICICIYIHIYTYMEGCLIEWTLFKNNYALKGGAYWGMGAYSSKEWGNYEFYIFHMFKHTTQNKHKILLVTDNTYTHTYGNTSVQ